MERDWGHFERTGRILDYLAYRQSYQAEGPEQGQDFRFLQLNPNISAKEKDKQNGGEHCTYRHDINGGTNWGI
ncbi:hypothetical protein FACS1894111_07400 [Clostridia bacterium]|nr:hypothetical protein FACS1894111_07400 [Clostridia bacterium]